MKIVSNGKVRSVGPHGATFIPHVSKDCDLSWTNNGGLENPETVNIKGPQGDPGVSSKKNLLDNWYFPRPINQREVSGTITAAGYFIDRWKLVSGSVKITNNGLVLNGIIEQILEFPANGSVTASALTMSGLISASYNDTTKTFQIVSSGSTIIAAKLERGNSQTLVDSDGKLADDPPNQTLELLKCQRYLYVLKAVSYSPICIGHMYGSSRIDCPFVFPVPLYKKPSVSYSGIFALQYYNTYKTSEIGTSKDITSVAFDRFDHRNQRCTVQIWVKSGFIPSTYLGYPVIFENGSGTTSIICSAELDHTATASVSEYDVAPGSIVNTQ